LGIEQDIVQGQRETYRPRVARPLVAHVIFRLDVGGLENGLVNLINGMPADRYRHAIVCIDDHTAFASRIKRDDVEIVAIHKKPGTDIAALWRLYRVFRRLKPDIVHTRNLAALDALVPAFLAGVPSRVHSEHGWDVNDLEGRNRKLRLLRKLHSPFVHRYVALSRHLKQYLVEIVGIPDARVDQLYNGVDTERFEARNRQLSPVLPAEFRFEGAVVIGTVGRLQPVKDPLALVSAFSLLLRDNEEIAAYARLAIIGDGSLRDAVKQRLRDENISELAWLPGSRDDIPAILRSLDVFVLPSLAEGISNTILEAMAAGLPVIATNVGGNPELVDDGVTGTLVAPADYDSLAQAMRRYLNDADLRASHGVAGAERARRLFSMQAMIDGYLRLYDSLQQLEQSV
jgi:sugar transferase (PEP-CTERM/EpsH1 system associated)